MSLQQRNNEQVNLLSADFQLRYESNFAWKSAVSALQAIPGLIGAWPMSVLRLDNATDRVRDVAGGGYHLTDTNGCGFRHDNLVPMVNLPGTNEYLIRTAGAASWASVIGTETHVASTQRGLFLGGWFYFDDAPAAVEYMIAKWGAAGTRSYALRRSAAGDATFIVSNDGTASNSVSIAGALVTTSTWYFVAGRFDNDDNELKIWVNAATNTAVDNNTIFDGTSDFTIGARDGPAEHMDGRASLCFLSQMAANDALAFSLFQQTRAMFGV